jgi:hypothetical protein
MSNGTCISLLSILLACADGPPPPRAGRDAGARADAGPASGDAGSIPGADAGAEPVPGPDAGGRPDAGDVTPPMRGDGMWLSREEIMALPMSGEAWENVLGAANASAGAPDLSDQDQDNNVLVLARALVYVRTGDERYRTEVRAACLDAMETENGGRTLALGRELVAYVIAADLVGLEPAEDAEFRAWLTGVRDETLDGRTLVSTHDERPNNWGTHAGASRIAIDIYLGDAADLERAASVFRGWLGERSAYAGFEYGELDWQCDASAPVGINPVGCTRSGHSIDGVIPDDQRRAGGFTWPPPRENYVWEGLQGAVVQAELLARQGYDAWSWGDRALLRAVQWLHDQADFPATGDDSWTPWLVNFAYGSSFPTSSPAQAGKNMGYTDWTHAR